MVVIRLEPTVEGINNYLKSVGGKYIIMNLFKHAIKGSLSYEGLLTSVRFNENGKPVNTSAYAIRKFGFFEQ